MQTKKYFQKIKDLQNGSQKSQEDFIVEFMPIIKKYSRWLNYEDSQQDLVLFFIELLSKYSLQNYKSDAEFISYISKSFYHQYIKLSTQQQTKKKLVVPFQDNYISDSENEIPSDNKILISQLLKHLSQTQKRILTLKYYYGFTDLDISAKLGLSRQTVNKQKNLALRELKLLINENDAAS